MKNGKFIIGGLAAVLGLYLLLKFLGQKSATNAATTVSPTASTGTFGGFDNLYAGLLGQPNYNPNGTNSNTVNTLNAVKAIAGAVPSITSGLSALSSTNLNPFNWSIWGSQTTTNNPTLPTTPATTGYDSITPDYSNGITPDYSSYA